MDVEKLLNKLAKSGAVNGEEFMIISGALWSIIALNNRPEITPEELYKTYGSDLKHLK